MVCNVDHPSQRLIEEHQLKGGSMKVLIAAALLLNFSLASAKSNAIETIASIETVEITQQKTKPEPEPTPEPTPSEQPDRLEKTGRIISTARDMVALGEAVYELWNKNRPKVTTKYAPISVVPSKLMADGTRDIINPFDLEGFSLPVQKSFRTAVKNNLGKEIVVIEYKVMYSYGGSLDGAGKYLTSVIIIPGRIVAKTGWTVDAEMKVAGVMNHGSRANPVAGVLLTMKYQMNSLSSSTERNDTIHITGDGQFRQYIQ